MMIKKRLLSMLLCCCMLLTLLPTAVFAESGGEGTTQCVCETGCTAEQMNRECPVCGAADALPENCSKYISAEDEDIGSAGVAEAPENPSRQSAAEKVQTMTDALQDTDSISTENAEVAEMPALIADESTESSEKKNIRFRIEWGEHEGAEIPNSMSVAVFKGTRADLEDKDFNVTNQIVAKYSIAAEDNWMLSIHLDKFDADGNEINYSVMVTKIGDYEVKYHNSPSDNATVSAPDSWITIGNWISSVSGDETSGFTIETYYKEFTFSVKYQFVGDTPEGVAAPVDSSQYKWGDSYTVASVPKVDGWTFDGWYPYYNSVKLYGDKVNQGAAKQIDTSLNNWNATYYGKWTKESEQTRAAMTITESAVAQRQVLNEETGVLEWNTVYNSADSTGNSQPLMAGDKITYTINVTNETDAFIKGFTITDTFSGAGKLTLSDKYFDFEDNNNGTYTLRLKDDWGVDKHNTTYVKLNYVVQDGDTVSETTGAAPKMLTNTVTVTCDGKDDIAVLETPVNTGTFDLLVEKKWSSSGTKAPVTVQLQKNGTPVEQGGEITIDSPNTAYGVFKDLPLRDENGSRIDYSVKETKIDGAAYIGTEPNVDFGDGAKTCDVFETNDKTGKWYAFYDDQDASDGRVTITNQYARNEVVVNKEIVEIKIDGQSIYNNLDGSNTDNVPTLHAGDTIEYKISVYNNTKSNITVRIYDWLTGGQKAVKILDETIEKEYAADDSIGLRKNENQQIEAGKEFLMYASYTIQKGDGAWDSTDSKYYLKNEIEVHYGGVIYSDEVENEIEKDGDAYEVYVPIIKTLYNDSEDAFNSERFYFSVYTDFSDNERFEWGYYLPYIEVSNVAAGSSKTENNSDDAGNVEWSFTMTQEKLDSLPVDEDTNLPYVMITEYNEGTDKITYDSNSYKLYIVPEKDSGMPMLLSNNYDPAETHTCYAIADLEAWNKEGSEPYDCAAEFVNCYGKQEDPVLYNVTFDANGGTLTGETKVKTGSNGKLASLPVPSRENHTFIGWFTDADGGEQITTDTVFTEDATVYAQWNKTPGGGDESDTKKPGGDPIAPKNDGTASHKNDDTASHKNGDTALPKNEDTAAPGTGDASNPALWLALLFAGGAGIFTTVYRSRRRRGEK